MGNSISNDLSHTVNVFKQELTNSIKDVTGNVENVNSGMLTTVRSNITNILNRSITNTVNKPDPQVQNVVNKVLSKAQSMIKDKNALADRVKTAITNTTFLSTCGDMGSVSGITECLLSDAMNALGRDPTLSNVIRQADQVMFDVTAPFRDYINSLISRIISIIVLIVAATVVICLAVALLISSLYSSRC